MLSSHMRVPKHSGPGHFLPLYKQGLTSKPENPAHVVKEPCFKIFLQIIEHESEVKTIAKGLKPNNIP